ncbi:MAG: hypothetical protein ILNGONEN_00440 [Syntrophorhabdaceae bacterium]|nr:hypothetical protein [Syntrophorhabdaceae bacterium]
MPDERNDSMLIGKAVITRRVRGENRIVKAVSDPFFRKNTNQLHVVVMIVKVASAIRRRHGNVKSHRFEFVELLCVCGAQNVGSGMLQHIQHVARPIKDRIKIDVIPDPVVRIGARNSGVIQIIPHHHAVV